MTFTLHKLFLLAASLLIGMISFLPDARAEGGAAPAAVQGVLDASAYDFEGQGSILLNGEWEFYWSELLDPDAISDKQEDRRRFYSVPRTWVDESADGVRISNIGYATYRLTVRIPEALTGRQLGIYMPSVATSYRLWINGTLSAFNGAVGTNREEMVPKNYRKVVYFRPEAKDVELVVQVANFVQRKGGLWESIRFGTEDQIAYKRDTNVVAQMFAIGSLCAMGAYHLGFFAFRRKNKTFLFFGLTCLTIALRTAVLGETLLVRLYPALSWELAVKVEYITTALGLTFFLLFSYYLFPHEASKKWVFPASILTALYCVGVLLVEARIYTYWMPYFSGFAAVMFIYLTCCFFMAIYRKREGATLHAVAIVIFFAAVVNDALFYNHLIQTNEMVSTGLLLYLFVQAIILSANFSRAYVQTELLSAELQQLNTSLERKVAERTFALEQANERLSQANRDLTLMESSRRSLLSNISHELRTPLTSIQGYVKALMDGTIKSNSLKYLELVYQKTKTLDYIFRDLVLLSKLEARKLEFHFESIPVRKLVYDLFGKYEWDLTNEGLHVNMVDRLDVPFEGEPTVEADPIRVEQVFANFITNAKKFTPAGGNVQVVAAMLAEEGDASYLRISIVDSGPGLAEEEQTLIFDPYYRGDHARKAKRGGTGLGLAISKEIIDSHQGRIGVESLQGKGSAFYFDLPISRGKAGDA